MRSNRALVERVFLRVDRGDRGHVDDPSRRGRAGQDMGWLGPVSYTHLDVYKRQVNGSMSVLADLIADQRRLYNPYEWMGMQEKIKSRYTMEEERLMFDAIMQGKTVKQALKLYVQAMEERKNKKGGASASGDEEEIELF